MDLQPGIKLDDWIIGEQLGTGGFGSVYSATHASSGRTAAIKILHADLVSAPGAVDRFEREIAAVRRIQHPGVIEILGSGRDPDSAPYFAMELLQGRELADHIAESGRLQPAELLAVLLPVCEALAAAHDAGIVHRDIKATNVFLTGDGRTVLLDFGIAKILNDGGATLTLSRQIIGTPCAMAPEQLTGDSVDARTDVYALGALTYHMLTGELPFNAPSATLMQHLHRHARRQRPSTKAPVSPELDRLVVTAMSRDPAQRPRDARAYAAALVEAIEGAHRSEAEPVPALLVRLQLHFLDETPEAVDAAGRLWTAARTALRNHGFSCAAPASRSAIFALLDRPGAPRLDAARLSLELAEQRARHGTPAVDIEFSFQTGAVDVANDTIVGGDAFFPNSWPPPSRPTVEMQK